MLKLHKYPAVTHPFSPLGIKKKKKKKKEPNPNMRKPNRTPPNHMLLLPHSALHCQTICCGCAQWRVCLQAVVHIKNPLHLVLMWL